MYSSWMAICSMNRSMNLKKSYRLCTLSPVRKSSVTMTSSGLNESGQQVMFVHHNNFALSLMNVWDITSYMYDHPAVILAKLTPQEQLSLQGTFGVWTDAKVLLTMAVQGTIVPGRLRSVPGE